jgi:hypothetical protein
LAVEKDLLPSAISERCEVGWLRLDVMIAVLRAKTRSL